MPTLTVSNPDGGAFTYRFDQEVVTVGRAAECDLMVRDPSMSRVHAEIRRIGAGWMVIDRGSRNGTRLNQEPVLRPLRLAAGDQIALGDTRITFDGPPPGGAVDGSQGATSSVPWPQRGPVARDAETGLVGDSPAMRRVLATLDRIAPSMVSVLITGENGTGKELAARHIHRRSRRSTGPFVVVNCPAIHGALLEPELFGVERGVATGVDARRGWFEAAAGGTLFLDEIGDMDLAAQAKILRFLQEKTIQRVGGRKPISLDVRVVAATHHDLTRDVAQGTFRRDLYHRLKTVSVELPALRERREDVPLLVAHFLAHGEGPEVTLSEDALQRLLAHPFPGNVRELEHAIDGARVMAEGSVIRPDDLPIEIRTTCGAPEPVAAVSVTNDASDLYRRIVDDGGSFWTVVHQPFLRRQISREQAERFIEHALAAAGGSYKAMARRFRIESEYKRLMNFLDYHGLGSKRRDQGPGAPRDRRSPPGVDQGSDR